MTCDNCNKDKPLIRAFVITGRRGRPPIKMVCQNCLETDNTLRLPAEKVERTRSENGDSPARTIAGFDSAALFLLDMLPENLFERSDPSHMKYRCKGCKAIVSPTEKNDHHRKHKAQLKAAA